MAKNPIESQNFPDFVILEQMVLRVYKKILKIFLFDDKLAENDKLKIGSLPQGGYMNLENVFEGIKAVDSKMTNQHILNLILDKILHIFDNKKEIFFKHAT